MIDILIPMEPFGAPRHRARVLRMGDTSRVQTYADPRFVTAGQTLGVHLKTLGAQPLPHDVPLFAGLLAVQSRPKRYMRKKDPDGYLLAHGKPDNDNIEKAVWDTLKTYGYLQDDCLIRMNMTLRVIAPKATATTAYMALLVCPLAAKERIQHFTEGLLLLAEGAGVP